MELKETNHRYYCSGSNYYVDGRGSNNFGRCDYKTWQEFKEDWLDKDNKIDDDYNHCFRFDIEEALDEEGDSTGKFGLWLFFMLQRKGIFRPVWIKTLTETDMPEVEQFLKDRWEYLKSQWIEFSNKSQVL